MRKRILAVMLSAVLAVTMLAGCGDSVETGGRAETKERKVRDKDKESQDTDRESGDKDKESRAGEEEPNETIRSVQKIQYSPDGSVLAHEGWEYNTYGDLVKNTIYKPDGSISGGTMVEYERNGAGDVTKAVSYGLSDGSIRGWGEMEYDALGREVKYAEYKSDGSISGWYEIGYDAAGNQTKMTQYKSDGSIDAWYETEYDAAGNQTKATEYKSDGGISAWAEMEYDAAGNQTKVTRYKSDGSISGWNEIEYDAAGREVNYTEYNSDGSVGPRYSREYDVDGHEIKRTYYGSTGSIIGWYEREYDSDDSSAQYKLYGSLREEYESESRSDYGWEYLGPDNGFKLIRTGGTAKLDPEILEIHSEVQEIKKKETPDKYWNIVLFGIDNQEENQLYKSARSKMCVIISINTDTQEVKLVNIDKDTYLNIGTYSGNKETCNKAMMAYMDGGAEQAIKMLNRNLDMNLNDFIAIGLPTWVQLIDGLGGIWVDVNDVVRSSINNRLGLYLGSGYEPYIIETTGYQQLNGMQVATWIWDVSGILDLSRAIFADPEIINQLFSGSFTDEIYTNLSLEKMDTFRDILGNNENDVENFPRDGLSQRGNIGAKGSCLIPLDLESNVIWLHQFLFEQEDYEVSDAVQEISAQIIDDTSKYLEE